MKFNIEIKEEAQFDILEASEWYESRQIGLGNRFKTEVLNYIEYLKTNALSHQKKYKENRELLVKSFPYVIVYRVVNLIVYVLAVANCEQHPTKKTEKAISPDLKIGRSLTNISLKRSLPKELNWDAIAG